MFDVRRIAQGLLVAFTLTLLVPPMPAWALRQGAAAQSEETMAGLEEGLTGQPTTMNRRQFLKAAMGIASGAAAGGYVGGGVADAITSPTAEDVLTGSRKPLTSPEARAIAIPAGAIAGGMIAGGLMAAALAPADAEKVLGELVDATVGPVKGITEAGRTLIVLVDSEVADVGVISQTANHLRSIPGYPTILVDDLSREEYYRTSLQTKPRERHHMIRLVAKTDLQPGDAREDTVYVGGLKGSQSGHLLPAIVTQAVALWRQSWTWRTSTPRPLLFDATPYLALRDLTTEQVVGVIYARFA